ncbi:hypothetical protein PVK06_001318 [Gossypium arboreum]|uniref:Uncharacterized protein n=1 Tax=Gossypium arboreum TaxID=29729 RepID=A0ABR0R1P6_GOSAR|nr:hypothetical protein PVK06_001318 [Gossypium arboreum]
MVLKGFLGTALPPSSFLPRIDGQLVNNPAFIVHKKQDKFLASWLLSTVMDELLVHPTAAKTSFDIWTTIDRKFGTKSNIKISSMRHALYSIKKTNLTIKVYLSKVKSLSDSLTAASSLVTEQEQVSIILAGLLIEFESIQVLASATPMSLELVTKMLLDCEARQMALLTEVPLQANLVSQLQQGNLDNMKSGSDSNRGFIKDTGVKPPSIMRSPSSLPSARDSSAMASSLASGAPDAISARRRLRVVSARGDDMKKQENSISMGHVMEYNKH